MIPGGYILQPRCFDESSSAHLPPVTRELWFYLLRKVNHKDKGKIKRGQGFFCLGDIQKDLSWMVGYRRKMYSKPQLTKSLRRLREGNMVETTKETRGVMVTVCKYATYQDPKEYEGNAEGSTKEPRRKREGRTINKNDKNEKKEKKENTKQIPERPDFISSSLWQSLLDNRKFKKLQNTELALKTFCNSISVGIEKGYTAEECIGEYVSSSWKRFNVDWMNGKDKQQTWDVPAKKETARDKRSADALELLKGMG